MIPALVLLLLAGAMLAIALRWEVSPPPGYGRVIPRLILATIILLLACCALSTAAQAAPSTAKVRRVVAPAYRDAVRRLYGEELGRIACRQPKRGKYRCVLRHAWIWGREAEWITCLYFPFSSDDPDGVYEDLSSQLRVGRGYVICFSRR